MQDKISKQSCPSYVFDIYAKSKALSVEPYTGDKDCERYITADDAIKICDETITNLIKDIMRANKEALEKVLMVTIK